jgi:hypothetical protein
MAEIVPTGPYFGFTYAQLLTELTNMIARRQRISGLIGSSINGNSFQREGAQAELRTLDQQVAQLQDAMAYLRSDLHQASPSRSTVISFRDC